MSFLKNILKGGTLKPDVRQELSAKSNLTLLFKKTPTLRAYALLNYKYYRQTLTICQI